VSVIGAPSSWINHAAATPRHARGGVAAVRRRLTAAERRLGRRVGLGALAALAVALALVWVRLQLVHTGYDLSTARQIERRLEQEQRELQIEIATRTSPRRLEEMARGRLGMGPPAPGQIVTRP
jgi:cell division protein FtsL